MAIAELANLITYNPVAIPSNASLEEAMQTMDSEGIRHFPIVDNDRRLVGVVSDRDVAKAVLARRAWGQGSHDDLAACSVSEIVHRDPIVIDVGSSLRETLLLLVMHRLHALPVLDEGRLVGMLTSSDFLTEFGYGALPGHEELVSQFLVEDERGWIEGSSTVEEARSVMQERGLDHVVVTLGDCPLGVLSFGDLRHAAEFDESPRATPVLADLVRDRAASIRATATLGEAAQMMREKRVKALPVVDKANRLIGLISEDTILRVMAQRLPA